MSVRAYGSIQRKKENAIEVLHTDINFNRVVCLSFFVIKKKRTFSIPIFTLESIYVPGHTILGMLNYRF